MNTQDTTPANGQDAMKANRGRFPWIKLKFHGCDVEPIVLDRLHEIKACFMDKIIPEPYTSCWLWTAGVAGGYAAFVWNGRRMPANRAAFELFKGPIPSGMFVCHRCDTPLCVNPEHLFAGTQFDNMQDAQRKGRLKQPDTWGASNPRGNRKLTEAQVLEIAALKGVAENDPALQSKYGVGRVCIEEIWRGKTWTHLTTGILN